MTLLLIIFGLTYLLIATEKVDKTVAAGLGAAVMVMGGFVEYGKALAHIDLNVIFLLIGMMMIVNIMSKTGLFEWLAITIAQKVKGNGIVIFMLFMAVTALFSAFLDNVTTVILMAPVTILITQILEIPTVPFLLFEALFSNIGGTATLVGDPPNILIGSSADLHFNQFLTHLGPVVLIIMAVTLTGVWLWQRKHMRVREEAKSRIMNARPKLAIIDPKRLKICLGVFGLVLLGFFVGHSFHLEPGIIALAGGLLMALLCGSNVHHVLEKVEWGTILFFIGLFMLVGALTENGVFVLLGDWVLDITRGNLLLTAVVILWVGALASSIVDNIPLVIAMIPLIHTIVPIYAQQMGITDAVAIRDQVTEPLFWSLALGACLGGNGSLIGASANVVISQIAKKNKYKMTFWSFTRCGFPVMIVSLLISTVYIYLRYFRLAG